MENAKVLSDNYQIALESRLSRTETLSDNLKEDVKEIKRDLRWLIGLIVGFNTSILGIIAKGFHWL